MPTWLASCGVGAGCIWFHGAKKILSEIQYLNALVASTASEFLKHNKRAKDLDEHDSGSEDDPENFNLKNLIIRKEWEQFREKRQNKL